MTRCLTPIVIACACTKTQRSEVAAKKPIATTPLCTALGPEQDKLRYLLFLSHVVVLLRDSQGARCLRVAAASVSG